MTIFVVFGFAWQARPFGDLVIAEHGSTFAVPSHAPLAIIGDIKCMFVIMRWMPWLLQHT